MFCFSPEIEPSHTVVTQDLDAQHDADQDLQREDVLRRQDAAIQRVAEVAKQCNVVYNPNADHA